MTEDDMIGWHHRLNIHEFEQDREAWRAAVHGVSKSQTKLNILVTQLCPTLCNLTDFSPPGSPVPGILQARTLEWVAISFSNT